MGSDRAHNTFKICGSESPIRLWQQNNNKLKRERKRPPIQIITSFVELGWCVGDEDERYHDEIGIDFGLT